MTILRFRSFGCATEVLPYKLGETVKPAQKLSYAICSILGIHGASTAIAADATARKHRSRSLKSWSPRSAAKENIQNVPITIQALTGETHRPVERREPGRHSSSFCPT